MKLYILSALVWLAGFLILSGQKRKATTPLAQDLSGFSHSSKPEPAVMQTKIQTDSSYPFTPSKIWYYIDQEGVRQGPISSSGIARAFEKGKLTIDSLVWNEELTDWIPVSSLLV